MKLPIRPQSGQKIPKNWFRDLYDYIVAATTIRGDKKNIAVTMTDAGQVIRFIGKNESILVGGHVLSSGYQGYFTIEDASETVEGQTVHKVKVWDPRTPDVQVQLCYVNQGLYAVESWTSDELSSGTTYIRIHFSAEDHTVEIETSNASPESDTSTDVYYQIGRVVIDNSGSMTILQDHCTGIPRMLWIGSFCQDESEQV